MSASIRALFPVQRFRRITDAYARSIVATLPQEYQKFYAEWKDNEPTPIHWIPKEGKWERNPETGEVQQIQNEPIPIKFPNEANQGLWGGEAVVEGHVKKRKYTKSVPYFWKPNLKRTVVNSEILDTYFSVLVTERALRLIDSHYGLDSYLLKTPAYDLQSLMAFKLKRLMLLALIDKSFCMDNLERQQELLEKYKPYLIPREEADWYGLSVPEAAEKWAAILRERERAKIYPLKIKLRSELIEELRARAT